MARITKSIIVEDHSPHSDLLTEALQNTGYPIEIKETCVNINDALVAINRHKPDLVFLDIRLGGNTKGGFELLYQIKDIQFDIIFTTAYIDENISEIRRCGLYYFVKPYIQAEVNDVITRYWERTHENYSTGHIEALKANLLEDNIQDKTIYITNANESYPLRIKNIIYCYTNDPVLGLVFYSNNSELIAASKKNSGNAGFSVHPCNTKPADYECLILHTKLTMKQTEADFAPLLFCPVHKSYLVNLLHVKKFVSRKTRPSEIIMSNGDVLPVSANGKNTFLKRTGRL